MKKLSIDMIKLIRNKWFLILFFLSYSWLPWVLFQTTYNNEILLQRLYRSAGPPNPKEAIKLYRRMISSEPTRNEIDSLYRLVEVLERAGRKEEVITVLEQMLKLMIEDENLRFRLAVALHNDGRYLEAEKHFIRLLKEEEKNE